MKKVILCALFLSAFVTANAVETTKIFKDYHAEACDTVREAEELYEESELDSDQLYETTFQACKG